MSLNGVAMLELSSINSHYDKAHILHNLSLSVQQGQVVALLGRNGAGKSTTLKTIMQLVRPTSGTILFTGRDITKMAPYRVARMGLGYVPEDRRIFTDLTVLENLEVGRQNPRENVPRWTSAHMFELFPNLAERRYNRGKELSGGEQQMLTIARTLMGNPRLLLLDEPSEGIAPVIIEQMAKTLIEIKTFGLTVLISEQNMHFAQLVADRALTIESGAIKFEGSFSELEVNTKIKDLYLAV